MSLPPHKFPREARNAQRRAAVKHQRPFSIGDAVRFRDGEEGEWSCGTVRELAPDGRPLAAAGPSTPRLWACVEHEDDAAPATHSHSSSHARRPVAAGASGSQQSRPRPATATPLKPPAGQPRTPERTAARPRNASFGSVNSHDDSSRRPHTRPAAGTLSRTSLPRSSAPSSATSSPLSAPPAAAAGAGPPALGAARGRHADPAAAGHESPVRELPGGGFACLEPVTKEERAAVLGAFFESWRGDPPPEELEPHIDGVEAVVHSDRSAERFLAYRQEPAEGTRPEKPITVFHGMTCRDGTLPRVAAAVARDGLDPERCRASVHGVGAYVAAKGDKAFMYARNARWHAGDGRELHSRPLRILVLALLPGKVEKGELHKHHDCVTVDTGGSVLRATQFCIPAPQRYRMLVTHLLTITDPPLPPAALKRQQQQQQQCGASPRAAEAAHARSGSPPPYQPPSPGPPAAAQSRGRSPGRGAHDGTRLGSRAHRLMLAASVCRQLEQQLGRAGSPAEAPAPLAAPGPSPGGSPLRDLGASMRQADWTQAWAQSRENVFECAEEGGNDCSSDASRGEG
eukprot:TRINITY_DN4798_c2_g1_i1.p1 TRINITY_DN4798_c2_g1~~TRINITY_DN4798_c2_g1_i1.p1  ORF type:complete len:596 (+),score=180.74 TRINITY_DN4798_c2_g1_i1:76-1788(+)